jgi:hypothetical protein
LADPNRRPKWGGQNNLTGDASFQNQLKLFPGGAVRLLSPDEAAKVYYASNPGITVDAANLMGGQCDSGTGGSVYRRRRERRR